MKGLYIACIFLTICQIVSPFNTVEASEVTGSTSIKISEVAFREEHDFVEIVANEDIELGGVRLYEGASTLVTEFQPISLSKNDIVVVRFKQEDKISETESNSTGKGDNGIWDVYVSDTGLTATDNVLRLQQPGTVSVSIEDTIDAVVWTNMNEDLTTSQATVEALNAVGHWYYDDPSFEDDIVFLDSDDVKEGLSIQRIDVNNDSNHENDWEITSELNLGIVNVGIESVTPTPTLIPEQPTVTPIPTITPTVEPSPTPILEPTNTPTPTIEDAPDDADEIIVTIIGDNEIVVDDVTELMVTSNVDVNNAQYKVEATSGTKWYDARTVIDEETSLAWNASWSKFPVVNISETDALSVFYQIQESNEYSVRLKVRLEDGDIVYSNIISVLVAEDSSNDDTVEDVVVDDTSEDESTDERSEDQIVEDEVVVEYHKVLIKDLYAMNTGDHVEVKGVIVSILNELGKKHLYLSDNERGLLAVIPDQLNAAFERGKVVVVKGIIVTSHGQVAINVNEISSIEENLDVNPRSIKTGSVDETTTGSLVKVTGEVTKTDGDTFYVNDGSGDVKVYIKESAGIDKPYMRQGYYASIVGIVNSYNGQIRILPRIQTDLIVSKSDTNTSVLGDKDITELPKTGYGNHIYGFFFVGAGLLLRIYRRRFLM